MSAVPEPTSVAIRWIARRDGLDLAVRARESGGEVRLDNIGALRPWKLRIPPGVAHGYKVLGTEPALLVYLTNCFYDPADEGRIPYDHPDINYDWELQHK